MIKTIISFLILCSLNLTGQYSRIYPTSKLTLNFSSKIQVDSFSNKYTYCYDRDKKSNLIFFESGYKEIVDSSKKDSNIFIKILYNGLEDSKNNNALVINTHWQKNDFRVKYISIDSNIKMKFIPQDSILIIGNFIHTSTFLIIPYKDFFSKTIEFTFPFYNKMEFYLKSNKQKIKSKIDLSVYI